MSNRWDETWHRLREWTNGQAPSERLAAQILLHESYEHLDPSHPLGGPDGTKDAVAVKDGNRWIMAVYFPRGQQAFAEIKKKFLNDLSGVSRNSANGIAFVTNQEITLAERRHLAEISAPFATDLYHLERITAILDIPEMDRVRYQFLNISANDPTVVSTNLVNHGVVGGSMIMSNNQMGGQVAHQIINIGSRPRTLSAILLESLSRELRKEAPESYRIDHIAGDSETEALSIQLEHLLNESGWTLLVRGAQQHFTPTTPKGLHIYSFTLRRPPALLRFRLAEVGLAPFGWCDDYAEKYFAMYPIRERTKDHVGIVIGANHSVVRCRFCGYTAAADQEYCNQCGKGSFAS